VKLAIMQPYFFPYIGYWQLIHAADIFVLFDDVQYMHHGWINRNRILKQGPGWQYILVPLQKHSTFEIIKNIKPHKESDWMNLIMKQLQHYKKKAPYFNQTISILNTIFTSMDTRNITYINFSIAKEIGEILELNTQFLISSEQNFDYSNVNDPGEWALRISEQMKADEYINPMSGRALFSAEKFQSSGIKLSFLKSNECLYDQRREFEPWLSIMDVLMFNKIGDVKSMIKNYRIG
jgi:hypothetical protein